MHVDELLIEERFAFHNTMQSGIKVHAAEEVHDILVDGCRDCDAQELTFVEHL
ncbi:MAG: hypothetical protein KIT54_02630 [Phycisphaeraceae bacterium]|nr:hypothetical protein [Phycisphaeraceae bacterium]